jgi:starch phosphorylase
MELFAEGIHGRDAERIILERDTYPENETEYIFHGYVNTTRPSSEYTPRIIPCYEEIAVPMEDNHILWQH